MFSSSGGNAGLAAATACHHLNVPCTVVVPKTTKERMINKIKKANAEVIVHGDHWKEADTYLQDTLMKSIDNKTTESIYVHPFDHPDIWEGHSTMIDEIVNSLTKDQLDHVKGIVCSVGGGGLYNGIIRGLERHDLAERIPVIAVETKGCDSFNICVREGKYTQLDKISSVATSLGSTAISKQTYQFLQKYKSKSVVLDDKDVVTTCLRYAEEYNIITEPACGASIHLGFNIDIVEKCLGEKLSPKDIIIVIVCGGSATTISDMQNMTF